MILHVELILFWILGVNKIIHKFYFHSLFSVGNRKIWNHFFFCTSKLYFSDRIVWTNQQVRGKKTIFSKGE